MTKKKKREKENNSKLFKLKTPLNMRFRGLGMRGLQWRMGNVDPENTEDDHMAV